MPPRRPRRDETEEEPKRGPPNVPATIPLRVSKNNQHQALQIPSLAPTEYLDKKTPVTTGSLDAVRWTVNDLLEVE